MSHITPRASSVSRPRAIVTTLPSLPVDRTGPNREDVSRERTLSWGGESSIKMLNSWEIPSLLFLN